MPIPDILMCMFHKCLAKSHFPGAWKTATVVPILKKPNSLEVNDHRLISLLPLPGKLMEKVRLGIDVACTAKHQASLADEAGRFLWQGWRFRTSPAELDVLWAKIPDGVQVDVVGREELRDRWEEAHAAFGATGPSKAQHQNLYSREFASELS